MSMLIIALLVVVGALVVATLGRFVYTFVRHRGQRLVSCPETQRPAAVRVHAVNAALSSLRGHPRLQLNACSRWPEREGCGQECLANISATPTGCMVRNILARWYDGKQCVLCGTDVDVEHWYTHEPALLDAEGQTLEWRELPVLELEKILETHRPVCWNCHIIESVIREHPERVVFRP